MSVSRGRRVLLAAFAISVLLHLLGGNTLHWTIPSPVEQSERLTVSHIAVIRVAHNTPPPPRPVLLPTLAPLKIAVPIAVPHTSAVRGRLSTLPVATAQPVIQFTTPEPTPTVLATPSAAPSAGGCAKPDAQAGVLKKPDSIEIPLQARTTAVNAVAQVRVILDPQGQVTGALIANSSGSPALDAVAENYARASTYSPSYQACKPVASSYVFRVRFTSQ